MRCTAICPECGHTCSQNDPHPSSDHYCVRAHVFNDKTRVETVNHPSHYGGDTTYEVIKVLEAWCLDQSFCLGNTVKYIARAGKKGDRHLEDLKKAAWYLNRAIERLERDGK